MDEIFDQLEVLAGNEVQCISQMLSLGRTTLPAFSLILYVFNEQQASFSSALAWWLMQIVCNSLEPV